MVDSKHQWKAWLYLLPAIILLIVFTVWPIINTVTTAFVYDIEYKPVSIQVENVENAEDEYRFFYVDSSEGNKYYMGAVADENGSVNLEYVDSADGSNSVFKYNDDIAAWTVKVGEKQYFVGADEDSGAELFEANNENIAKLGSSIYPAGLFSGNANKYITADLDTNSSYNIGIFKGVSEAFRYVLATSDNGYLDTTDTLDESALLWSESCKIGDKNGFKLYLDQDEDWEPDCYMNATVGEDGSVYVEYSADDGIGFTYNKNHKAWTCVVDETEYYLGLDGINRISLYPLSDVADENAPAPAVMYLHRSDASEAKEQTSLRDGYAYRIGAHRSANGTQTYVTTGSASSGLMLTEDFINGEVFSKFGMNNFVYVLTSKGSDFMVCLKNTFILTVITVPVSTALALLIAVGLNSIKPLQRLLQTIFFLPYVTNSIAIGMVFSAMFNIIGYNTSMPSYGIINNILGIFGMDPVNWMNNGSPYWANIVVLVVYIVWNALPFKILILLGGLQSVNKQYYDAAKIDSTPKLRVFTKITVPLLSPMIVYVVITGFIGGFKEYSSIVGIFGDDMQAPAGESLNTMVGYIYKQLGQDHEGQASAAALILFAIIFVVTMINLYVSKKKTHF